MATDRTTALAPSGGATLPWLLPSLVYVLLVGLLGVTTKLALEELRWPELVLWTALAYFVNALGLVVVGGERLHSGPGAHWGALSGAFAATALITLFLALSTGEVSRVIPITSSYPAVTLLLAALVLREHVTRPRMAATSLVIVGVILVSVD